MKLNDLFDCIYYINLNARVDRNNKFWELNKNLLDKERTIRIEGLDVSNKKNNTDYHSVMNARTAISISYLKPFYHALHNNFNEILIFEDDAEPLIEDINYIDSLKKEANQLNYEILFLGGTIESKLYKATSNLFELNGNILATQAVCYNNRRSIFNEFLNFPNNFESMKNFLISNNGCCMDTIIGNHLTKVRKSFIPKDLIFGQYESHSDIDARVVSYNNEMQRRFIKFTI